MTDPLILEIEDERRQRENERMDKLRADEDAEEKVIEKAGPCPSILDALPGLERAYVEYCVEHKTDEMVLTALFQHQLKTPSYVEWLEKIDIAAKGCSSWSRSTLHDRWSQRELARVISELVERWNEQHPQLLCTYIPSKVFMTGVLSIKHNTKRTKRE